MRISDWSSDVCSSDLRVSTATVDRVLNRRASVRDSTVQQVLKAAAELDYLPEKNLRTALNPKPMRISFLLPKGTNRFINMLGDTIHYSQENWAPFNVKSRAAYIEGLNHALLARSEKRRVGKECVSTCRSRGRR